ncbi:MAG: amidohydrolase family protein, partial [Gemmatimonadota bacterium]
MTPDRRRAFCVRNDWSGLLPALLAFCVTAAPAGAQQHRPGAATLVVRGGVLIDGTGAGPVANSVVVIRDGRITAAGKAGAVAVPSGARVIDAHGKWIIPGLVDAHVHYGQSGWFDARPDAANVQARYPYPETVALLRDHPERFFAADLCSGVTATFDVGGYPWTRAFQARGELDPHVPHVAAAGALLTTIDATVNVPDERQFVFMASDSAVRATVRSHAAMGSQAIKVWYIVPRSWTSADSARFSRLVHIAGAEADSVGLPLIVHATGLWEAKDAIRAGARVLVHSVFEAPVDDEFITLAREHHVVYIPTMAVLEGYDNMDMGMSPDSLPYPVACVDAATKAKIAGGLADSLRPAWARGPKPHPPASPMLGNALANLMRVHRAGITVAMGTDAGNPGTLHGPSVYREMDLMQRAGLTPMEVLVDATRNGARAMGRGADFGTLERGKSGDLVVLDADPLADIANARR